jgi:hypothetical protein
MGRLRAVLPMVSMGLARPFRTGIHPLWHSSGVNGHSVLPAHGHENSPLAAMRIPQ